MDKQVFDKIIQSVDTASSNGKHVAQVKNNYYSAKPWLEENLYESIKNNFPFLYGKNRLSVPQMKYHLNSIGADPHDLIDSKLEKFMAFMLLLRNKSNTPVFTRGNNPFTIRLFNTSNVYVLAHAPVGDAPVGDAPVGDAPVEDAPVAPVEDAPVAPVEDAPVEDAPVAPVEDAPVAPVEDAPVGDAPVEDAPVGDAPDAPVEDAPVEEVEDAPVEEVEVKKKKRTSTRKKTTK